MNPIREVLPSVSFRRDWCDTSERMVRGGSAREREKERETERERERETEREREKERERGERERRREIGDNIKG